MGDSNLSQSASADSSQPANPIQTPSAESVSLVIPADSSVVPESVLSPTPDVITVASASAVLSGDGPIPAESSGSVAPSQVDSEPHPSPMPTSQPTEPVPQPALQETVPVEATPGGSIGDSSPPIQPIQVQPEAPVNTPSGTQHSSDAGASQSAGIEPEPLEGPSNTPTADPISQNSSLDPKRPLKGFGDIIVGSGKPSTPVPPRTPSQPAATPTPISSPKPPSVSKSTFGDLMGSKPAVEPTINIEPIEPPKVQTPITSSPASPPSIPSNPTDSKLDAQSRREKSIQARKQKREMNIARLLGLFGTKSKANNQNVRDFLHVSQTTATDYLHTLVKNGKIRKEGKGKATVYSLV